jgi:hypothetical protein|tara:strand:- start:179 stop:829 length:651 start_codon:yes stop_codon:yes gene_type:complete
VVSTLKVTNIQIPNSDSDVISLDASTGNIAFNKPVTGTAMVKLLETDVTSSASEIIIDGTYINETYETYFISWSGAGSYDGYRLRCQFYTSATQSGNGTIASGSHHGHGSHSMQDTGVHNTNTDTQCRLTNSTIGNNTGEGYVLWGYLLGANRTDVPVQFMGQQTTFYTDGQQEACNFVGGMVTPGTYGAYYCRGIRLYHSSGTIETAKLKLYGIS